MRVRGEVDERDAGRRDGDLARVCAGVAVDGLDNFSPVKTTVALEPPAKGLV